VDLAVAHDSDRHAGHRRCVKPGAPSFATQRRQHRFPVALERRGAHAPPTAQIVEVGRVAARDQKTLTDLHAQAQHAPGSPQALSGCSSSVSHLLARHATDCAGLYVQKVGRPNDYPDYEELYVR
jgi:hypothetical protein